MRNDGGTLWGGTRLWTDYIWISPDPTFGARAQRIGQFVHPVGAGLAAGESYTSTEDVVVPAGFDGPVLPLCRDRLGLRGHGARGDSPSGAPARDELARGYYGAHVYEGVADIDNFRRTTIDVTYREPDLKITSITLPDGPLLSGHDVTVKFTVSNVGTRETRQWVWDDRLYLSSDPSLDRTDLQVGVVRALRPARVSAAATSARRRSGIPADAERPVLRDRVHRLRRVRHRPVRRRGDRSASPRFGSSRTPCPSSATRATTRPSSRSTSRSRPRPTCA